MASFFKIGAVAAGVIALVGSAILWRVHKRKTTAQILAEDARVTRIRAEQGDAQAQYQLGYMYYKGKGAPQDNSEAVRWYRKAAEQNDRFAQYGLGFMYELGKGTPRDYAEAARWFRRAADQGDRMAQYELGYMSYYGGTGLPQDNVVAALWFRASADQGDALAQRYLGIMYRNGQGVARDYSEALRWFRSAASQGDQTAEIALVIMYYHGEGTPRNYFEAARWLGEDLVTHGRWTYLLALLLFSSLFVPTRRWGRATWLPSALASVGCAAVVVHVLLRKIDSWRSPGAVLLAAGSAFFVVSAVVEAVRASKRASEQGQTPTAA